MDFLMSALRAEMVGSAGGRPTTTIALIDKIAALHDKELKDLRFELSLYRKEAFRLQSENDELRSQVENMKGQVRNVSPATTIPTTTSSTRTSSSSSNGAATTTTLPVVPTFYQQAPTAPQHSNPFVMQSTTSSSSNNNQNNTNTRVRQHVKLPTARRASKSSAGKGGSSSNSSSSSSSRVDSSDDDSSRLSFPLDPPLPRKFQGDRDAALEAELPVFDAIVNYPNPATEANTGRRQCTMCGSHRAFHVKAENKDDAVIPSQNKGVCTACDTKVWVVKATDMQVKWCKGCKNFQCWAAFGDKGWATKCCACRKRMADSYAAKKEQKKARVL